MRSAAGFLRRQAEEIAADPALRAYGAVLALLHVLAAYWIRQGGKLALLAPGAEAICWPLLPDCEWLRVLPPAGLELATLLWGLCGGPGAPTPACASSWSSSWPSSRPTSGCGATSTAWRSG